MNIAGPQLHTHIIVCLLYIWTYIGRKPSAECRLCRSCADRTFNEKKKKKKKFHYKYVNECNNIEHFAFSTNMYLIQTNYNDSLCSLIFIFAKHKFNDKFHFFKSNIYKKLRKKKNMLVALMCMDKWHLNKLLRNNISLNSFDKLLFFLAFVSFSWWLHDWWWNLKMKKNKHNSKLANIIYRNNNQR